MSEHESPRARDRRELAEMLEELLELSREARAARRARGRRGTELPRLLDCAALARKLGITRTAAEAIMRHVPKVTVEGLAKVYVREADVRAYLDSRAAKSAWIR
jgi:phage baseplate assembly protein W